MTNNVVAYFSSSLDSKGHFKEYRAVSGSTFNDEYSEILDSGTLVLSQIRKENRLFTIKPYDYVHVVNKKDPSKFNKYYYVDNFNEKENNIKEHLFGYTINLMSETKILEKIQCPNLTITHDVNNGEIQKLSIYEHIRRYMELYVPKIKYCDDDETWHYEPLIKMPSANAGVVTTTTINVDFSSSDFEPAEVPDVYVLEISSNELTDVSDYSSVVIKSTVCEGGVVLNNLSSSFNPITHKIEVYGETENVGSGTIVITYEYEGFSEFYNRFSANCADMSFSAPTLRQLLTTLMQQVGCIPTVKNRTLNFLDFQKEAVPFGYDSETRQVDYTLHNTVNFIRRNLSSDSFVNTLANLSDNVLDSENEVICETLCFRDSNNVLLRQQENLKLETSLPIYKVNKCIMHGSGTNTGLLSSSYGCFYCQTDTSESYWNIAAMSSQGSTGGLAGYNYRPYIFYKEAIIGANEVTVDFRISSVSPSSDRQTGRVDIEGICFWGKRTKTTTRGT